MNTPRRPPLALSIAGYCSLGLLFIATAASCQVVVATIPLTPGGGGGDVAVNETTNRIYVLQQSATQVIDGATDSVIASVAIGSDPAAVAVNQATNMIYVANQSSDTVTAIDGSNNVGNDILVGGGPLALAINAVTNKIYVTCQSSDQLAIINGANNNVTLLPVGSSPVRVAVDTHNNRVYVVNQNGNSVTVVDGATDSLVATLPTAEVSPSAIAINEGTGKIYVASTGKVTIIDAATNAISSIATAIGTGNITGIVLNPSTNKVYVSASTAGVDVIDGALASDTRIGFCCGGGVPSGIAINPITNRIYVTESFSGDLTVVDGTNNVFSAVSIGGFTNHVAVNRTTGRIYVSNSRATVAVIDKATPVVTWAAPAAIVYGTALGGLQLNAMTPTAGTFTYAPANGTLLDAGSQTLSAIFTPTDTTAFQVVTSTVPLTVNKASSALLIVSDHNPAVAGSTVTYTATVASTTSGTPSGAIMFHDGPNTIGSATLDSGGRGSISVTASIAGSHPITGAYSGDQNFLAGSSSPLHQDVTNPDFSLAMPASSATLRAGQSTTITLTVNSSGNFADPIDFSCSGLPLFATCTFTPARLTPGSGNPTTSLVIKTSGINALNLYPRQKSRPLNPWTMPGGVGFLASVLISGTKRRNSARWKSHTVIISILLLTLAGSSCGGGGSVSTAVPPPIANVTPQGNSTITINAVSNPSAGPVNHSTTLTLTVTQ